MTNLAQGDRFARCSPLYCGFVSSAGLTMVQVVHSYQAPHKKAPQTSIIIHLIRCLESVVTSLELDYDLCSTYLL